MSTFIPIQQGQTIASMVRAAHPNASEAEISNLVAQVLQDNNLEDNGPGSSAWRIPTGQPIDMSAVYGSQGNTPMNQTGVAGSIFSSSNPTAQLLDQYMQYQFMMQQQQMMFQQNPFGVAYNNGFPPGMNFGQAPGANFASPQGFNFAAPQGFNFGQPPAVDFSTQGGFGNPYALLNAQLGTNDMYARAAILAGIDPFTARQLAAGLVF